MLDDFYIFAYGAAVVMDTAVLMSVLDRRRWRYTAAPVALVVFAIWVFHVGVFSHKLVLESGAWSSSTRFAAMSAMAAGLLLMPCGMLHSALRVHCTGLQLLKRLNPWYAFCYAPMILLFPIMASIADDPMGAFHIQTEDYRNVYLVATGLVNLFACAVFWRTQRKLPEPEMRSFLRTMGLMLLLLTGLIWTLLFTISSLSPARQQTAVLIASLAPEALIAVLAYFVIRYNFLQLVLERSLIYGSALVGLLIFHQAVVAEWGQHWGVSLGVNFGVIETVLFAALVLSYRPLRNRAAESLRYLVSSDTSETRVRVQRLAAQIGQFSDQPDNSPLQWFAASLEDAIDAPVQLWQFDATQDSPQNAGTLNAPLHDAQSLAAHMQQENQDWMTLRTAPSSDLLESFRLNRAWLAVRWEQSDSQGLALVGRKHLRSKELSGEEISECVLLVQLFGGAMQAAELRRERLEAERHAMQNEKLSTLGLLTSCMAHEIRNPLSSIKTIATVLHEQLVGTDHQEDVDLILGEVNRLSDTTSNLLQFARPAAAQSKSCDIGVAARSLAYILAHLAQRRNVKLELQIAEDLPLAAAEEIAVREILMNLMLNSLQAAPAGGWVRVCCEQSGAEQVEIQIQDNGPGVAPEVQDHIFDPFVTTKDDGSGLGLYIVSRRVRELDGEIQCTSDPQKGATFTVRIPILGSNDSPN